MRNKPNPACLAGWSRRSFSGDGSLSEGGSGVERANQTPFGRATANFKDGIYMVDISFLYENYITYFKVRVKNKKTVGSFKKVHGLKISRGGCEIE